MAKLSKFAILSCSSSIAAMAVPMTAFAQADEAADEVVAVDQDAEGGATSASSENLIIVTGTSIRGVEGTGSEVVALGAEDIEANVMASVIDLAKTIPQIQNLGFGAAPTSGQGGGGNDTRGTALNIRGLGPTATLVLVNGHKMPQTGSNLAFTDAGQIPLAAIERVDVVLDGSSAIYGSSAVAGVVNYMLKKRHDGVTVSGNFMANRHFSEWGGSIIAGESWDGGSVVATYTYQESEAMRYSESPFMRQDLTQFGGNDNRLIAPMNGLGGPGVPGNIIVRQGPNVTYYGLPAGTDGIGLTVDDLLPNQPNLSDLADYADYLPHDVKHQASLYAEQYFGNHRLYFEGVYHNRKSEYEYADAENRTITSASPLYISDIPGVAPGAPITVNYNTARDYIAVRRPTDETFYGTLGFVAALPSSWEAEAALTYGSNKVCGNCNDNQVNSRGARVVLDDVGVIEDAIASGAYNPLSSFPAPQEALDLFLTSHVQTNHMQRLNAVLKANGPLFDLPYGTVRAAVGVEYMDDKVHSIRNTFGVDEKVGRDVKSVFAELYVPLLGDMPLIQSLDLSAAVRHEDYSDFGSTTNPKFGLTWDVNSDLTFRATYGTSFNAPGLPQLISGFRSSSVIEVQNQAGVATIPTDDPAGTTSTVIRVFGPAPKLDPETSENYSLSMDLHPSWLDGARLSVSYYNVKYSDQLRSTGLVSSTFLNTPEHYAQYSDFVFPVSQGPNCVNADPSTYSAEVQELLADSNYTVSTQLDACNAKAFILGGLVNAATVKQDGLDIEVGYSFESSIGDWDLVANVNKILGSTQRLTPGSAPVKAVGRINFPVSLRIRGNVGYSSGPFKANLFANYVGSYTNDLPITVGGVLQPIAEVDPWLTFDLSLRYTFEDLGGAGNNLRLGVNVQNLFDRDPHVVLSTNNSNPGVGYIPFAYDNQNANVFGRTLRLNLAYSF